MLLARAKSWSADQAGHRRRSTRATSLVQHGAAWCCMVHSGAWCTVVCGAPWCWGPAPVTCTCSPRRPRPKQRQAGVQKNPLPISNAKPQIHHKPHLCAYLHTPHRSETIFLGLRYSGSLPTNGCSSGGGKCAPRHTSVDKYASLAIRTLNHTLILILSLNTDTFGSTRWYSAHSVG